MPLFKITPAMLKKYPGHMRDLIARDKIKEQRALVRERIEGYKDLTSYIAKRVALIMAMVFLIIWAFHLWI